MLSRSQAVDAVHDLVGVHDTERSNLDQIRRYWKGRQDLPAVVPTSAPREVRKMAEVARVNVCDIVVDSLTQSLFVEGFRPGRDLPESSDDNLATWDAWQANRFDRGQVGVHRAGVAYGTSYTSVLPGDPFPVMRGHSPRQMTALYGWDRDWPTLALERWGDGFRLYDAEAVYTIVRGEAGSGRFEFVAAEEHGAGVVPVVRYLDSEDLDADDEPMASGFTLSAHSPIVMGQVAPLIKLQDQIDMTTFGLMVAQHYSAFRQRYAIGWVAETEQQLMKAAASQLWTFDEHPDEMKLGEFEQTNLDGYIKSREAALKYAATISQTPVHELIGELVNLSAEALAAAEAGRDRKVEERKTGFGESHEQTMQLVGGYMGVEVPRDAQVVWRDTSARSFAAVVDGLGKLTQMLHIPPQELWERVPGATQQDIARWKAAAEQGDSMAWLNDLLERQASDV